MRSADAVRLLRAELAQDLELIRENYSKNRQMTKRITAAAKDDEFDHAALGYTLHNLYNAFEAYFLRVAKFFENAVDDETWHMSLLDRMTLDIPETRPALLDRGTASSLHELLRFRHVFRNLYQQQLIPERVRWVNETAATLLDAFEPRHRRFDEFLDDLAHRLDGGA
ncbi:MAG: antitoxin [bacterium]